MLLEAKYLPSLCLYETITALLINNEALFYDNCAKYSIVSRLNRGYY